jgi:protein-disulfide isomerase
MKSLLIAFAITIAVTLLPAGAPAQGLPTQYPIRADDGDTVANFDLPADKLAKINALAGQVPVGNLNGDVTVMQFYDLNCPYCRAAAHDIDALVKADPKLKLIFVPYAVLSVQSVQGALIELGVAKMIKPWQYLDFHRRLYDSRGIIDGNRALAVAKDMGLDRAKVAAAGNTEANLDILRQSSTVGGDAGLMVTPAYVIGGVAIAGHPGLKSLQKIVVSMRKCGKIVCKLDDL